jgi:predicted glycoside hydrolase/deacetylase ChbG (UPF0249 family)
LKHFTNSKRKLIINADDFGFSKETVEKTIEFFQKGLISSATLMPNMPAFEEAVDFAIQHPQFSYGLHLCLSDENPLSEKKISLLLLILMESSYRQNNYGNVLQEVRFHVHNWR